MHWVEQTVIFQSRNTQSRMQRPERMQEKKLWENKYKMEPNLEAVLIAKPPGCNKERKKET